MRVVLWKSGNCAALIRALSDRGVDIVLLLGARHSEVDSLTSYELFFGTRQSTDAHVLPPPSPVSGNFLDEYSRCAGRIGFNPITRENNFRGGGVVHPDTVMDWAQFHLANAHLLLTEYAPDQVWMCNHPQMGFDNALVEAALGLDIPVLELTPLPIPAKFRFRIRHSSPIRDEAPVRDFRRLDMAGFTPDLFYMKTVERDARESQIRAIRRLAGTALKQRSPASLLAALYEYAVQRNWVTLPGLIERLDRNQALAASVRRGRRLWFRRQMHAVERGARSIPAADPFIYFPLHYEPEVAVSAVGGGFYNQVNAIQALHAILPKNWRILLKENPKQAYLHRDAAFYRRIESMERVDFVHAETSSPRLIEVAKLVATVNGTAGFEALRAGKACVYFGEPWYAMLPGAVSFDADVDLEALTHIEIDQEHVDTELSDATQGFADGLAHHWMKAILPLSTSSDELAETTADSLVRIAHA